MAENRKLVELSFTDKELAVMVTALAMLAAIPREVLDLVSIPREVMDLTQVQEAADQLLERMREIYREQAERYREEAGKR